MASFWGELKRRKVFRVAAVYAVVAWLIVQVVGAISDPLSLPPWFNTFVIVLLAIGFPVAVVFAWAFDLTPQGIRASADAPTGISSAQSTTHKITLISQALVLFAVGFLVFDQYVLSNLEPSPGRPSEAALQPLNRFSYFLPEGQNLRGADTGHLAVSPTGRHFVYNSNEGLRLRSLDELEARLIPGTEDIQLRHPFFSADGRYVGGLDARQLKRISITGGVARSIAQICHPLFGATWTEDDTILCGQEDGIYRVPAAGGDPVLIAAAQDGEWLANPFLLPDGDSMLMSVGEREDFTLARVTLYSLSTGERRVLIERGTDALYLHDGYLVFAVDGSLFGVAFDLETLSVASEQVRLVSDVHMNRFRTFANYGLSNDGTLVYLQDTQALRGLVNLVWIDRAGNETPAGMPSCNCWHPVLSPDGRRVLLSRSDEDTGEQRRWIWSFDMQTGMRLGPSPAAFWSPDSQRIVYYTLGDGLVSRAADGTGEVGQPSMGPPWFPGGYDADGNLILGTNGDIHRLDPSGDGGPEPLLVREFNDVSPALSPNGDLVAYESNETGTPEIYVRPYPDIDAGNLKVSEGGGREPKWSPDGSRLYFISPTHLMEAVIVIDPELQRQTPERLFATDDIAGGLPNQSSYSVSPDDQRFLMFRPAEAMDANQQPQFVIVQNWTEELRRLVPTQ